MFRNMFLNANIAGLRGSGISSWDTSSAYNMDQMFHNTTGNPGNLTGWDTSGIISAYRFGWGNSDWPHAQQPDFPVETGSCLDPDYPNC